MCGEPLTAQLYRPVDKESSVKIIIKNDGMATDGTLTGLEGNIQFNSADLKNASFAITLYANTINTGIDVRDNAIKGEEYLDTKKFPAISFVSRQVTQINKAAPFTVKGTLTIKGISKEISFPFTAVQKEDGILFTGEMRINRLDFKIGVSSLDLSNSMSISLNVFAKKI